MKKIHRYNVEFMKTVDSLRVSADTHDLWFFDSSFGHNQNQ
jgi:hypothetical protein